jgi:hypothetical protein
MRKQIKINNIVIIVVVMITLIITLFYIQSEDIKTEQDFLEKYDLLGLSTEDMVTKLDYITNEDRGFKASITSTNLRISENGVEVVYEIPDDKFYLSFAPYILSTHPCATHSLSSCSSELKNEIFNITINDENGNILFSKEMKSMNNGFIGIWLPRDFKGILKVDYKEMSAEAEISTFINDNTCLTEGLILN